MAQDYVTPSSRPFIYITNDYDIARKPVYGVVVENNCCKSPSSTSCHTAGLVINGNDAGIEDVRIFDNDFEVYLNVTDPAAGAISLAASSAQGKIDRVQFGGNRVKNLQAAVGTTQTGLQIAGNVDNVRSVRPNTFDSCYYGLRTIAGAGPTLEFLDDQRFISCTTNTQYGQAVSRYAFSGYGLGPIGYATGAGGGVVQATSKSTGVTLNTLSGNITTSNANLAAGTRVSFTLTNSNISAGDLLILNHVSGGTIGSYGLNARASAAGSIIVDITNRTAGDLAEALVIKFAVFKGATS